MAGIEGYTSTTSVSQGQDIAFHVRAESGDFSWEIHRIEASDTKVASGTGRAAAYETPSNAYAVGCRWPAAFTLTIPEHWRSGVYLAHLSSAAGKSGDIFFIVKPRVPGLSSRILVALPVNTGQAYNAWGGKSLYGFNSSDGEASPRVSFERPSDELLRERELLFVRWIEAGGPPIDYCTSLDLHDDPAFLGAYQLLVSVGHDEYWSKAMRDHVEGFVAAGGNVAFFSGNVSFWQVRFEDGGRTMVGYKSELDPVAAVDPGQATVHWADPIVDRPENTLTGVAFRNGAGWWNTEAGPRPAVDYTVHFAEHWVFAGTGLKNGVGFGGSKLTVGYETDAAQLVLVDGVPEITGADGTPLNFAILASADLTSWGPGGQAGWVTMGLFHHRGVVFTAATTDWGNGLVPPEDAVQLITSNVLARLSLPDAASPPVANALFDRWAGDLPEGWERGGAGVVTRAVSPVEQRGAVVLDATAGPTWLRQPLELLQWRTAYRVSCWVKSGAEGATLRLVNASTAQAFAIAEHSGNGQWQEISATGRLDDAGPLFPARLELRLSSGVASFTAVKVEALT